jgi:hypothetical protein
MITAIQRYWLAIKHGLEIHQLKGFTSQKRKATKSGKIISAPVVHEV